MTTEKKETKGANMKVKKGGVDAPKGNTNAPKGVGMQQPPGAIPAISGEQAINVLIQGIEIAQKRGAFQLNETPLLYQAVQFFKVASQGPEGPDKPKDPQGSNVPEDKKPGEK